jgi:predicted nucleic acid-binding protein
MPPVVVDTNVLFSTLLRAKSSFGDALFHEDRSFVVNELVLTELFRHKERIVRLSSLSETDVVHLYHDLLRELVLYKEELLSPSSRSRAYTLCRGIDETDAPHVAIALELDALLWTGDEALKEGLREQGFTSFYEPES